MTAVWAIWAAVFAAMPRPVKILLAKVWTLFKTPVTPEKILPRKEPTALKAVWMPLRVPPKAPPRAFPNSAKPEPIPKVASERIPDSQSPSMKLAMELAKVNARLNPPVKGARTRPMSPRSDPKKAPSS